MEVQIPRPFCGFETVGSTFRRHSTLMNRWAIERQR